MSDCMRRVARHKGYNRGTKQKTLSAFSVWLLLRFIMMKNDPLQASLIVSGLGKKMEYKKWSKHGKALIADNHRY